MEMIKPTKRQTEYLAYIRKRKTAVDTREMSAAKYTSASAAREILEKLVRYGYLEKFDQKGLNGVVRPYYRALPIPKAKPIPKPKLAPKPEPKVEPVVEVEPVEEIKKYSHLKDVYDEANYEANIELLAKELFDYLEKDLKIKITLALSAKENESDFDEKINLKEEFLTKEEKKKIKAIKAARERKRRVERERIARKEYMQEMVNTWFPAWAHIQSFRFANPTGRFRTQEEINQVLETGQL